MRMKVTTSLLALVLIGAAKAAPLPAIPASLDFGHGPSYVQGPQGAAPDGITVSANGFTTAAATRARLNLHIRSRVPNITRASISPILDALVAAGVTRSSLVLPPTIDAAPTNFVTITATIEHPTPEMVRNGIQLVGRAFIAQPDLILNDGYAELVRADCAGDIDRAREEAIRNARVKAQKLASQAGVHVGKLLAVTVAGETALSTTGECLGGGISLSPTAQPLPSTESYLSVRIDSNITMRFAIK